MTSNLSDEIIQNGPSKIHKKAQDQAQDQVPTTSFCVRCIIVSTGVVSDGLNLQRLRSNPRRSWLPEAPCAIQGHQRCRGSSCARDALLCRVRKMVWEREQSGFPYQRQGSQENVSERCFSVSPTRKTIRWPNVFSHDIGSVFCAKNRILKRSLKLPWVWGRIMAYGRRSLRSTCRTKLPLTDSNHSSRARRCSNWRFGEENSKIPNLTDRISCQLGLISVLGLPQNASAENRRITIRIFRFPVITEHESPSFGSTVIWYRDASEASKRFSRFLSYSFYHFALVTNWPGALQSSVYFTIVDAVVSLRIALHIAVCG